MRNRPKPYYIRRMRREDPSDHDRRRLIRIYRRGGLKDFEPDVKVRMENIPIDQIFYTDPYTKESLKWLYVGNFWWCRHKLFGITDSKSPQGYKRVRKNTYEFARLMAIENKTDGSVEQIDGLWDSRRHELKIDPVIVHSTICSNRDGVVVGWNEFEVMIEWVNKETGLRGLAVPVRDPKVLEFEFVEDDKRFRKIFELIGKHNSVKKNL